MQQGQIFQYSCLVYYCFGIGERPNMSGCGTGTLPIKNMFLEMLFYSHWLSTTSHDAVGAGIPNLLRTYLTYLFHIRGEIGSVTR